MGYKSALSPGSLEADVAAELRSELARQNHSRRWLAAQCGLPHVTVARWLRADTAVGLSDLDAMCRVLGTTVVRLLVEVNRRRQASDRPTVAQVRAAAASGLAAAG